MTWEYPTLTGLPELRAWLVAQHFRATPDPLKRHGQADLVNWYAYRPAAGARPLDGPNRPPALVVRPCEIVAATIEHCSVEVQLTGERGGAWFQIKAYALSPDEFKRRLPEIEDMLVGAWNALPAPQEPGHAE